MIDETVPAAQPDKLYSGDVARVLGWTSPETIHLARMRTRRGTARVPFPKPDGADPIGKQVNSLMERPWWLPETIEAYRSACREATHKVTPDMVARMRRMVIDGRSVEAAAIAVGISKATAYRHLNKGERS